MAKWYYLVDGQEVGPLETADLKRLATLGRLNLHDKVRRADMTEWYAAKQIKGLLIAGPETHEGGSPTRTGPKINSTPAEDSAGSQVDRNDTKEKPTLIEQTAKRWKLVQLIGFLIIVTGCVIMVAALSIFGGESARQEDLAIGVAVYAGIPTLLVGITVSFIGRFYAWWHHG